jgi:hypothetical protein
LPRGTAAVSFGYELTEQVRAAIPEIPADAWLERSITTARCARTAGRGDHQPRATCTTRPSRWSARSPHARFASIDVSVESIAAAKRRGLPNAEFRDPARPAAVTPGHIHRDQRCGIVAGTAARRASAVRRPRA